MKTRKHVHEEDFPVAPDVLFALLVTPSSIREWWGASRVIVLPETDGVWAATWGGSEDDPDYVTAARIQEFSPPWRLVLGGYRYRSKGNPLPFEAEFVTEFVVERLDNGSRLRVVQDGFPGGEEADEFFAACQEGWCESFSSIRKFLDRPTGVT